MKTSAELIRRIEKQLMWASAIWFLWGISSAMGRWLSIKELQTDRTGALLWFGYSGLLLLAHLIEDCAKAILAAIRENEGET
jgi:hypothetical protein